MRKIVRTGHNFVIESLLQYMNIYKRIPKMFNPYNQAEIKDIAPTLTCNCGSWESSSTVLIIE